MTIIDKELTAIEVVMSSANRNIKSLTPSFGGELDGGEVVYIVPEQLNSMNLLGL